MPERIYQIRPFREDDIAAVETLGQPAIGSWSQAVTLHRVVTAPGAEGRVVAHLQVVDRATTPSRRPGRCDMRLLVAPDYRRQGIGSDLLGAALGFAWSRDARSLRASYMDEPDDAARSFLEHRGFVELQRYQASHLDLAAFDPDRFAPAVERVRRQGVILRSYAEAGDTPANRRRIYDLDVEVHHDIPLVETEPLYPESFEDWESSFARRDFSAIFLAEVAGQWVGLVRGLDWPFTGVRRSYRGRGIATALKLCSLRLAKERGLDRVETENCSANAPMLAINRQLGFTFTTPEVEMIRWLRVDDQRPA